MTAPAGHPPAASARSVRIRLAPRRPLAPIRTPVVGSGRLYALDVDGTLVAYTSSGADAAAGGV